VEGANGRNSGTALWSKARTGTRQPACARAFGVCGGWDIRRSRRLVLQRSDRFRDAVIDWAHGKEIAGFALVIGISAIATGLAYWLVRKFAPGAKGSGIPDVEAVLRDEQLPPPLILIPVKFVGGVLAMGAGLALGREGPTVQMGAGIGHFLQPPSAVTKMMSRRSWPRARVLG
jgi:CIC family chloride channel protein